MINIVKKTKELSKKTVKFVLAIIFIILSAIILINYTIIQESKDLIYKEISQIPNAQTALILGASVKPNKEMSDVFRDRVDSAIELYSTGKISKIIVSGDHGKKYYDEVNTAKKYLLEKGIPPENIFLDHAGFDTYDSLYRAKYIFNAKSIIIVTQNFHLPRAIFIAKKLGHNVYGFSADLHQYDDANKMFIREIFADVKAYFDVLLEEKPKLLGPKINLDGNGFDSWD
ncbi:MAG: ElyC/SanA/YdcF family protein [Candidatus Pacebacteria bacterium]|nr:ElyC/SanA/YdcF family protein [Candidatus Paceibacterota bacterium]